MSNTYYQFYYLQDNYTPIVVSALQIVIANCWYVKEVDCFVKRDRLFYTFEETVKNALKRVSINLKAKTLSELVMIELLRIAGIEKPHPKARTTNVPYLWVIDE